MTVYVKPAPGRKVRDPETRRHIPEAGVRVPRSVYWLRRLRDGDVVEANEPSAKPSTQASKSNKE